MLQAQTIEPHTLSLLKELMQIDCLSQFSLVGGTALALKFGHRHSIDLDLFNNEPFDSNFILVQLEQIFQGRLRFEDRNPKWAIFCYVDNIKVDIVKYPHSTINEIESIENIRMYSTPDIGAMKINAILGRGRKKDFWDLAELLNIYSFEELISFHKKKYPSQQLLISIPQAVTYFDDAEESEEPLSLKGQTWEGVKKFIRSEVSEYLL